MVDLWMPGAARHSLGNTGVMDGGPPRAVWHITSNDKDWTFGNEYGWFTGGGADVAPHLLWDPFSGSVAQMFPADSRSLSLQNAGDVKTNRTGQYCIQIECVFTEGETVNGRQYNTLAETPCNGLGAIVAWLRSLGIPDVWPAGPPTGFHRQDVTVDFWLGHGGHYGHCHVPGNSHIDPGPMPNLFAAGPTPQEDDMTPDQAAQLKELHDKLLPYMGWDYEGSKNPQGTGPETQDAYAYLRGTNAKVDALAQKVAAIQAQPLTDDQITKIASAVATNPALANAIADTLAARLKD